MVHNHPNPFRCLDQRQPIQDRLRWVHQRVQAIDSRIERLAFAVYQPRNDLLSTFVSHNSSGANLTFYDAPLAAIPSLQALASVRQCRV
ncbi:MAG: hypothetical protein VKI63_09595, partial [Cyanobium sp.]|nr:hypothetical protein [Cyanobium sp.]